MIDKLKNSRNLVLIIILIILVAIAIGLSIIKANNAKAANTDTKLSDASDQEKTEEPNSLLVVPMPEEQPAQVEEQTETEVKKEEAKVDSKYFIRVNYGQNVVTIYTKDAEGNYTVPYKAMVCSTGRATPRSGTYAIPSGAYSRATWGLMVGNVWAQYFTRIKGSILFHSVPYLSREKNNLEYWEYDKLGTTASAGCIRLTVEDAKWIYNNCPAGTNVEFYTDSNPGPLGKPTAQKISEHEAVRGWDPTDPDRNNPWNTYVPTQEPENNEPSTEPSAPNEGVTPETGEDQEPMLPGEGESSEDQEPTTPEEGEDSEDQEPTTPEDGEGSGDQEPTTPGEGEGSEDQEPTTPGEGEGSEDQEPTTPGEGEGPGDQEPTTLTESEE